MQNYFLMAELKTMANLLRRMAEQCPDLLRIDGLTAIQCIILEYLYENRGRDVFQRDLESEFQIRRSTVTGILQGMERRGLVLRLPVAQDARLKKLALTETGLALHAKAEQNMREVENRALEGVSEEDLLIFRRTLEKIKQNLM